MRAECCKDALRLDQRLLVFGEWVGKYSDAPPAWNTAFRPRNITVRMAIFRSAPPSKPK